MPKEHLKYMGNIIPQKVVFLTFKTDLFSLEKDATQYFFFIQSMCGKNQAFQIQIRRLSWFKGLTKIKSTVKYKVCNCLESISWKRKMLCSFYSA